MGGVAEKMKETKFGEGGKGNRRRGKGWNEWSDWNQPTQQDKGKGREKSGSKGKNPDPKLHWCDIHQKYGHSTDYCFDNPNRTGGKPIAEMRRDICYKTGHTTNYCYDNPKGFNNGKARPYEQAKGEKGKSNKGNRNWKSQNFPVDYKAEQATPALHDEAPSTVKAIAWWDTKEKDISSVCLDLEDHIDPVDNYDDDKIAEEIEMFVTCIFNNMDRQKNYLIKPTNQKLIEIIDHERHISEALSETNIHSQRIVQTFKDQVGYEGRMMKFITKNALKKMELNKRN